MIENSELNKIPVFKVTSSNPQPPVAINSRDLPSFKGEKWSGFCTAKLGGGGGSNDHDFLTIFSTSGTRVPWSNGQNKSILTMMSRPKFTDSR